MEVKYQDRDSKAVKLTLEKDGELIGRAFLFLIQNDLHQQHYALLEDVYIEKEFRGQGNGVKLVEAAINKAKELGCYKIIGTSRHSRNEVHQFYDKLGFIEHGKEFRINL